MANPTRAHDVVVVPHTHWDREWYRTFQAYRLRLVEAVDEIIDLLESGRLPHFLLDGQTVMLDDYLAIRPENRDRLRALVATGKLAIGPWYILPDEFLVSGEALVRNLLFGRRRMNAFGQVGAIGYLPDMFGHVAQMPQILKGFGMDQAVVWRGVDPKTERFWWEAPSGDRVATTFLPTGYCNLLFWSTLPLESRVTRLHDFLKEHHYARMLLLSGCDHLAPNHNLPEILAAVQAKWDEGTLRLGTLAEALDAPAADAQVIHGELRQGGRAYLLPDVLSARTYLKQANAELQTLWERYVEPLMALAAMAGDAQPDTYWEEGWRNILLNQPHDSICGCSIDEVHREMLGRWSEARELGETLLDRCMMTFAPAGTAPGVLVYNPLGWDRTDWTKVVVDWPLEGAPADVHLVNEQGNPIPCVLDRVEDTETFHADIHLFPDWHKVRRFHLTALVEETPSVGMRRLMAHPGAPAPMDPGVAHGPNTISNESLRLTVRDGALHLEDLDTGAHYTDVHTFEDGGDSGDEYNYSPPENDRIVTSQLEHWLVEKVTPVEVVLRVAYRLEMPEKVTDDRKHRSKRAVSTIVLSRFTLRSGSRMLEVETELDNRAKDHRLRVRFGTGLKDGVKAKSENQFCVTERPVALAPTQLPVPPLAEYVATTFPQQSWSAVEGDYGLLVAAPGLHEVEVVRDADGAHALCLTLLRSVGWLSRDDLRTRGGGAGPHFETPDAQCLGPQRFRYALLPYRDHWSAAQPAAHGFVAPMRSMAFGGAVAPLSGDRTPSPWLSVSDERIVVSTVKRTEGMETTTVRLYNPTEREIATEVTLKVPVREISRANLAEEPLETLGDGIVPLRMGPGQIVTLLVRV